uniref:Reverse transcriptase domain-containing protein n=1 Tax=Tanacetum cinerariifolium TaxID=118510 RepID=A0A6L2J4P4_TANCI|nr:reverse transcriptase domain-containing protein [Tanacetum cinerariifolium]
MADQCTMEELLRAPIKCYAEAIVVPPILAEQFELKHSLINMITSDQFFILEKDNPHDHIRWGNPSVAQKRTLTFYSHLGGILKQFQEAPPPASVKAIEEICVTCGGAHPYYQCLAADGNTFLELRDNIQGYVSAAAVNYNQGNSGYRPLDQPYQAPTQQNQVVPLSELEKVKRINEANMKAMQTQIHNVKNELRNEMKNLIQASMSNQTNELKNMMASFFQMNTASTSGSGSLLSNTIANPKGELKAITTRSSIVLDGPSVFIPPPFINPEEDEHVEETLTDEDLAEYTIKVPPPLKMLKALLSNKVKLLELANTPLNENCSSVILKKLPEKLGDPGKFLISCGFSELKCKALADLGANINLMPLSVWKKLEGDNILIEKLLDLDSLNINLLLVKIKFLSDNPTPDHDIDSFLEKSDTSLSYLDNSLPEYETFINHIEETNSGSTITHANYSLPKYDSFLFEIEPDQGKLTSVVMKDNLAEPRVHVPNVLTTHPTFMLDNLKPEYKIFFFDIEEKNSGSTTIHADISLLDLECFNFNDKPDPGELTSIVDFEIRENVPSATNVNLPPKNIILLSSLMLYGFFSLFSHIPWFLQIFSPSGIKIPFLTPASPIIISFLYCRMYLIGVKLS